MNIPFVDLKTQYLSHKEEFDTAIGKVLENARFIQGEEVRKFEEKFAEYIGAKYCVGVNSGTDALILGLRALDLKPGDEVLIPANTFIASSLPVSFFGMKPVFVDINESDFGINLDDLRNKITKRTKAIILVHLYGKPDKIEEVKSIIKKSSHHIYLIEDACQAHGAYYGKKRVGNYGVFSAFSFYPGKNLGAFGDGGAIVTNDAKLAKKYFLSREYGQVKKYYHKSIGVNSRLDTVQAAVLLTKLKYLDRWNKKRQEIASYYTNSLREKVPQVITPQEIKERKSVYHLYVIRTKKRDKLKEYLNSKGIQALIHYPIPLHLQEAYRFLGYSKGDLPVVERMSKEILSLPLFPEMTKQQVDYIVDSMQEFIIQ